MHIPITIYSIRLFSAVYILDLEMPRIYCLLSGAGSLLDREDSFPLEEGLNAGSSSTFFSEFFRMRVGLFSTLLASV